MTLGSLFSGIGGFELAATRAGIEPIWSNEIDSFCCKVLKKNFDHEIIEKDIREIGKHNLKAVDIITGGFPCQPFSQAGKRKGTKDDRYLWPEMLRIIRELKPSYIIGENVAGLISMENGKTLEGILIDLENEGYRTETFTIPACAVGAWHRRNRIWILGTHKNTKQFRCNGSKWEEKSNIRGQWESGTGNLQWVYRKKNVSNTTMPGFPDGRRASVGEQESEQKSKRLCSKSGRVQDVSDPKKAMCKQSGNSRTGRAGFADGNWWSTEPNVGRVAHGVPGRVDRLKGLGNAIVPEVMVEPFKAIQEYDKSIGYD